MYSVPVEYVERWLTADLQAAIQQHQIVILTGARQVGKSTLLRNAAPFRDWRFVTLDDYDALRQADESPQGLWAGTNQIILDEVQKVPKLLAAIKQAVDTHPGRYRFMLSGSANLLLMRQVSESLAGRAVYFVLDPLTAGEEHARPKPDLIERLLTGWLPAEQEFSTPAPDHLSIMLRGLLPALLPLANPRDWTRWWEGYVATYLERDLRQISQIDSLADFRRLMELAALRSGQVLNQTDLGRDAGLSQPTVHRYLNLLETTHLFERLQAYQINRGQRLIKSPKVMWNDPGLAVFLSGYYSAADLAMSRELGSFYELLIYHHIRVLTRLLTPSARLYFWRTGQGSEVDFVLEYGRKLIVFEVKHRSQANFGDTAGLRAFIAAYPHTQAGIVVTNGRAIQRLDEKIIAIPWTCLAGLDNVES